MLWFGRRPESAGSPDWPAEDAAGEMEVASTGRRGSAVPEADSGLPGARELDEALAALDALGEQRGPTIAQTKATSSEEDAAPSPDLPARSAERAPDATPPAEPRSPASRAYRRLRRIFPG